MIKIAPSILSADFCKLGEQLKKAEAAGADLIHCDIMDGHFVPNISFGPMVVEAVHRACSLPIETHLMISNPEKYVNHFRDAGSDALIVHCEGTIHLHRLIDDIKKAGMKAGIAVNPATPLVQIEDMLDLLDQVLIMGVNPGFGGQSLLEISVNKLRALAEIRSELKLEFLIGLDGGVDTTNAGMLAAAGNNIFVAGSSVFPNKIDTAIAAIRKQAEKK